jgi:hypothetical protein
MRIGIAFIATTMFCLVCSSLRAEPLDIRQVSAGAKWMAHFDVDAMRKATIVQQAYLAGCQQCSYFESALSMARDEVGVDPRVDVHGVTVFGENMGKLEGVAIIKADMQPLLMVKRAQNESGYRSSTYGSHEIHCWTDGNVAVAGSFFQPNTLVVAQTENEVQRALDVLDGKAPSLSVKQCPVATHAPEGSMALIWAEGLSKASAQSQCPLIAQCPWIKKSESLGVLVGEQRGELFTSVRMSMQEAETAQKVADVLKGLHSAAELQLEGNTAAIGILHAAKLSVSDKAISGELRVPANDVWTQVKGLLSKVKP